MNLKKTFILVQFILVFSLPVFAQRENISLDGQWSFMIDSTHQGINNKWFAVGLPGTKEIVKVPHT